MENAGARVFKRIRWKTGWPRRLYANGRHPVTFIAMGVNIGTHGERVKLLMLALKQMDQLSITRVLAVSSVYETPPWGVTKQADFYNCVAAISTSLAPMDLLRRLKAIEVHLGRKHRERWGPREIDMDIILSGKLRLNVPGLTIPHRHMAEREFVLVPLLEIAPTAQVPQGPRVSHLRLQRPTR